MMRNIRARALPLAIATLLAAAPAMAQNVTSAGVNGRVVDAQGQPVANATVQIVHEPSGTTKVVTTNADGRYAAQGLRVGGPFDITVSKSGMAQGEKDNVYLQLGQVSAVNLTLGAGVSNAQQLGSVTVTDSALTQTFNPDNKGLSTNVSQQELEANPAANRSIDDVARLDPRINVTNQGDGSISAMGLPNRFNDIQVDGVGVGDPFGLNANGLPYQNSPISQDTIAEYNISTSNYDVASDTVGADINAVTKSGTNEFHGSVYYVYQNADKMVGDAGWLNSNNPGYKYNGFDKNTTAGFTIGGPIVKDKLFFFLSAEKQKVTGIGADSTNGLDYSLGDGPSTSNKLSPGDVQKVINAANGLGLQAGGFGGASGVTLEDKRYLGKIDWNITDNHRASLSFSKTKETLPQILGNSSNSIGLSTYMYTKAIKTDNVSLQFFDDWSDNFSTETKIGYQHYTQDTQVPYQAPQVQVYVNGRYSSPSVYLGEEQYRHYNKIDTKKTTFYWAGTYYAGDHTIKGGIYAERNKIYNLFGRTEFGAYVFSSIADFAAGNYYSYNLYQPAAGYTINDVAAQWTYSQYSPFIQDTWQVNDNLSIQYGVRVNIPKANKKPIYNPQFQQTFGYPNNNTLSSKNKVVEPRFSFNYTFDSERMTQLRGGFGLFQTFPPSVWLTNPYQNNGMTVSTYYVYDPTQAAFSPDAFNQNIPAGGPSASQMDVDTISSNFKLPTVWKASLALDRELPWWGMIGSIEYQHTQAKNAIFYRALNIGAPTGTLPDGRQQFWSDPTTGSGSRYANADPSFYSLSTELSNTSKGKTDSLTLALSKPFSNDWSASAAFTLSHATEVNPAGSSQASSGYKYWARVNPNQEIASVAERDIPKSLKLGVTWRHAFFGDYNTMVSAFYTGHSGLPYTWIFSGDVNGDGVSYEDPIYIPTLNDPKVSYGSASAKLVQQFQNYIDSDAYLAKHRGQIAGINEARMPWVNTMNMSFQQEVPGFFKGNKGIIRLDIYNFLNLLNKKWGDVRYVGGYDTRTLSGYGGINAQGQYVYNLPTDSNGNFQPQQLETYDAGGNPTRVVSRWSAMLTLKYTF
ncbi:TonB-dependent receptor [Oleiagrimonas sp. MCCC 1A03011]|uniref:TonB-dependent receptor n=1 Tax=Oleiagrimonas sp. MCCC 1A03011 TaxID=1926883 RepID=UPI000DC51869|nr:TonB-dependent receptor [Oleiagrimonas sp. MCCC 1A03011]RAP56271.1 Oar protein [Oleiagrimonas sp. MCCC 1A03011]